MTKNIFYKREAQIEFNVQFGFEKVKISILKVYLSARDFPRVLLSSGNYGKVYQADINYVSFAIKSQTITSQDRAHLNSSIDEIIKEICFYKIASSLRFGPAYHRIFGFDILLFDDSIEFAMEVCDRNRGHPERMESDLMQGLKLMHSLNIVHRDIKDANISWSPTFSKWVFLDFGFATFLKQSTGQKSKTKFIGTYNWASDELKKLSLLKTWGWVDFYYNDLQATQKVVTLFQERVAESESDSSRADDWTNIHALKKVDRIMDNHLDFRSWCSFFRVKYCLFKFTSLENLIL